jgi:Meiotically up-regulated gene 113/Firmicute plasmid replication protein (RepL)
MIYLIACAETNCCKIGYSSNPTSRLIQLQTGNPFPLELISVIEGDLTLETKLHNQFVEFRLQGEWFILNDSIKTFFGVTNSVTIYASVVSVLAELALSTQVLIPYLLFKADNLNRITLVKHDTENLAIEATMSVFTIKKAISNLVKKAILIKQTAGVYLINPKYYWRGTINNRKKSLKYILELEFKSQI